MSRAGSRNVPITCEVMFHCSFGPINAHVAFIKYVCVCRCVSTFVNSSGGVVAVAVGVSVCFSSSVSPVGGSTILALMPPLTHLSYLLSN